MTSLFTYKYFISKYHDFMSLSINIVGLALLATTTYQDLFKLI